MTLWIVDKAEKEAQGRAKHWFAHRLKSCCKREGLIVDYLLHELLTAWVAQKTSSLLMPQRTGKALTRERQCIDTTAVLLRQVTRISSEWPRGLGRGRLQRKRKSSTRAYGILNKAVTVISSDCNALGAPTSIESALSLNNRRLTARILPAFSRCRITLISRHSFGMLATD